MAEIKHVEKKASAIDALHKLGNNGEFQFVRAWRDEPTVEKVAKRLALSKDEVRALAQAMRSAGVKLPRKYQGKLGTINKGLVAGLNDILAGKMVEELPDNVDAMDDDDDEESDIAS